MRTHVRSSRSPLGATRQAGFTMVEMLTATALALVIMLIMTTYFGQLAGSTTRFRAAVEMRGQLRGAAMRLQRDLEGVTARMLPPLDPARNQGYFEYVEGPVGPIYWPCRRNQLNNRVVLTPANLANIQALAMSETDTTVDTTLGDSDDILMFTTRSLRDPYTGLTNINTTSVTNTTLPSSNSNEAEIAWFVRGTKLYRRQLLVNPPNMRILIGDVVDDNSSSAIDPQVSSKTANSAFSSSYSYYRNFDVSVRLEAPGTAYDGQLRTSERQRLVPNTLGDLTKRENRFAHQPITRKVGTNSAFPFDIRFWGELGLPTLGETSHDAWPFPVYTRYPGRIQSSVFIAPNFAGSTITFGTRANNAGLPGHMGLIVPYRTAGFDARLMPNALLGTSPLNGNLQSDLNNSGSGYQGFRIEEDIVLANVLSFDVKAWDPGAPVFVNSTTNDPIRPGHLEYLSKVQAINWSTATTCPVTFGAYVDLNYMCPLGSLSTNAAAPNYGLPPAGTAYYDAPQPRFHGPGDSRSRLVGQGPIPANTTAYNNALASVYDTWSTHYENNGIDEDGNNTPDQGSNGVDDNGIGGIDDVTEQEAPPPYTGELRGIQITIRVYEPDSQEIREISIVQDFVPE